MNQTSKSKKKKMNQKDRTLIIGSLFLSLATVIYLCFYVYQHFGKSLRKNESDESEYNDVIFRRRIDELKPYPVLYEVIDSNTGKVVLFGKKNPGSEKIKISDPSTWPKESSNDKKLDDIDQKLDQLIQIKTIQK